MHIQPQDTLLVLTDGDAVHIRSIPASFTQKLRGLHKHIWEQLPRDWLEEERAEWDRTNSLDVKSSDKQALLREIDR